MRPATAKTATIGATLGLCLLAVTAGAAEMPASIARCKAIGDDAARLACYDAASGRSSEGYITSSSAGAAAAAGSGGAAATPATTAPAAMASGEPQPKPQANSFESRIRTVTRRPNGMWMIALEDGTSWLQADPTQEWTLEAGDAVVLTRGAVGAWFVKKSGTNRTFRVRPDTR